LRSWRLLWLLLPGLTQLHLLAGGGLQWSKRCACRCVTLHYLRALPDGRVCRRACCRRCRRATRPRLPLLRLLLRLLLLLLLPPPLYVFLYAAEELLQDAQCSCQHFSVKGRAVLLWAFPGEGTRTTAKTTAAVSPTPLLFSSHRDAAAGSSSKAPPTTSAPSPTLAAAAALLTAASER
jgi:hypothetical protein